MQSLLGFLFLLTAFVKPVDTSDVIAAYLFCAPKGKVRIASGGDGW